MALNRVPSKLPQRFVKTYRLRSPISTHFRQVRCEDVACPNQERGFRIVVDPETDRGRRQAYLIKESRRRYWIEPRQDGLRNYHFPPGQQCFYIHRVPLEREPLCIVQAGDWRTPGRLRQPRAMPGTEWLDRFGHHQLEIAARVARG